MNWLNIKALAEKLLKPANKVVGVRYYTAHVSGRIDPGAPGRQQIYLDALRTVPEISLHMGAFLLSEKFAGLVQPPEFRPRITLPQPWPDVVKVIKVEEKGSDVISPVTCCSMLSRTISMSPQSCRTIVIWSNPFALSRKSLASRSGSCRR